MKHRLVLTATLTPAVTSCASAVDVPKGHATNARAPLFNRHHFFPVRPLHPSYGGFAQRLLKFLVGQPIPY
jgi:hypothetical protein